MTKDNLALILAREGTDTISRQNLRLVNGKPLIKYVIDQVLAEKSCDVYVSTDSNEIKELSKIYGIKIIDRPKSLAMDHATIEEITLHAISYLRDNGIVYKKCLVLNPMLPLIKKQTIKSFFSHLNSKVNTIFGYTVVEEKHAHVTKQINKISTLEEINTDIVNIKKIVSFNCQSFFVAKGFEKPYYGLQLLPNEVFSVNSYHDFAKLEKLITRRKILVRVNGSSSIGLGHVYNMLTILNHFRDDEIFIVMHNKKKLGFEKFKENLYKIKFVKNNSEFLKIMSIFNPDIVINDILDTSESYIKRLKQDGIFVVNFEDLGYGRKYADLVFNPIYLSKKKSKNEFYGSKYACVRDEFYLWKKPQTNKSVKKILITFGGSDSNNLTKQVLEIIKKSKLNQIHFKVILGLGYSRKNDIQLMGNYMRKHGFSIEIIEKSNLMAKYISESDIVITSNGRTVFEIASLNVPMIIISTNKREEKHPFLRYSCGGIFLGIHTKINSENYCVH
ncbi:cytidylyltransferase domain-containing protein [Nitrosarchaeum sp. AC2]|uniref:cytidylyltransferase domain-containing protein n=1 Tax=Nitrosarchaeum sp. AC2 TaxID=2259673 RepID=UPI0015CA2376|nr:glycosyltransferase [Nitrosarchaeum sp. AC2]QLH10225.1 hypothetical protein DSQ20_00910 [Nitrosarchaeum sp. AC2]